MGRHGRAAARHLRGVPRQRPGVHLGTGAARRLVPAGCAPRRRRGAAPGPGGRGAARTVRGDGVAGRAVARARGPPGRRDRPQPGRDRRRVRGGRALPRRRRGGGGAAQPDACRAPGQRRHGVGRRARFLGAGAAGREGRRVGGRRGQRAAFGGGLRADPRPGAAGGGLRRGRRPGAAGPGPVRLALAAGGGVAGAAAGAAGRPVAAARRGAVRVVGER